jgi:methionyl-tRNA formyltransferase
MAQQGGARVVFMGTPEFAVPTLRKLAAMYDVALVVTQPDKPAGRGRRPSAPPVRVAAEQLGIPVIQPERVRAPEVLDHLRGVRPDVIITAAYGQLLPQALLDIPRCGCLNVHASILPRWRGAAPIHRAVMAGDTETGVTLMRMVLELDAGPILGTRRIPIGPDDDTGVIHDRLAELGADLVAELLPRYLSGELEPVPQPAEGVTYAERIRPEDEWIRWNAPVVAVHNQVRGLRPWPGASTLAGGERLKIWRTALEPAPPKGRPVPGTVVADRDAVWVACADGWLRLVEVQPAGRRRMPALDWWRGRRSELLILGTPEGAKTL